MELIQGILTRRSVRNYIAQEKISKKDMERLFQAAMQAPSAMNKQPWSFIVVDDSEILAKIEKLHPYAAFVKEAGTAVIVCGNRADCFEEYWKVDPLLAGQNLLLAAHALGLGACWCGVYPDKTRMQNFSKLFHLPQNILPMALIAIGIPSRPIGAPTKRYDPQKVHFNQW